MKLLKKINKGLIIAIIVIVALITYIVSLEIQRNKEKGAIKEACEEYLAFENKYTVLPKEYRSFSNKIPEDKLKEYKEEAVEELKKLMVKDENIYNLQKSIIEEKIQDQTLLQKIYTKKNSKLVTITKYEFDDNQVTVTIEDSMETEYIQKDEEKDEQITRNKTNKIEDTITLKKDNEDWKVIFADVGMNQEMYEYYN